MDLKYNAIPEHSSASTIVQYTAVLMITMEATTVATMEAATVVAPTEVAPMVVASLEDLL